MFTQAQATAILRQALANPAAEFRNDQWEAIDALVNHRQRLLVVQRTGWGKSAVYFIATRLLRDQGAGPTLIISPLLALMRNQVEAARRLGVNALTLNSTNRDDWPSLQQQVLNGQADVLLVSPEHLANEEFMTTVLLPMAQRLGLLVVDEAHCISDWGHDFRPDYRRIVNILQRLPPNLPVLGTTATANDRVIDDVVGQLGNLRVLRGRLMRESLQLQTLVLPDQTARLAWLADTLRGLEGTGIVYALTKRDAEQVAAWLREQGLASRAYYSGATDPGFETTDAYRQHLEDELQHNRLKILVATSALGMGYDKPDVAFVIHYQTPGSVIDYYQQVGRAGRSIGQAYGILLSGTEDEAIQDYFRRSAFPAERHVQAILEALNDSDDGMSIPAIEAAINLRRGRIEHALKLLSVENPSPVIKDGSRWRRTPVPYLLDHERIARLTGRREREWQQILDYIATPGCKMRFLAEALDDSEPADCGRCASCLGRPLLDPRPQHATAVAAARLLRHSEFPLELKKQVALGSFPGYGFRGNLPLNLRAKTGRVLARWRDAGWGESVAAGKQAGRFADELVEAVAEMIRDRWQPEPAPAWMTCIPSRAHPDLVPDFVRRLAARLGLPFHPVIVKLRDNAPQKQQQNRFHQCHNLDGVFGIQGEPPATPVLLVDDMVDSGWTLTVAAALLRQAGVGPVWPLALADSGTGD
ncbi:MAG: RecQ family ATP-dependent DNA helicase [Pseudomonadota bacterium]|nr:RecQ family ATP-dependent DNA helicase [Pseudomonadota bacterium]